MFQAARIKLTFWYLLICVMISFVFSLAIFTILQRDLQLNEIRFEQRFASMQDIDPDFYIHLQLHRQDVHATEDELLTKLIYINLFILGAASVAGYFLAGRTLKPIKMMVEKQNLFIADASHELRTPLTALKTAIEVNLRNSKLDIKKARLVLKENLKDVDRLKNLSDNLLSLAKLQANTGYLKEPVSLKQTLENAVNNVSFLAKQKKISIEKNLHDVTVEGNKDRLIELFIIFLDNAIKYSHANSSITIETLVQNSSIETIINDHGIGIHEKDIPHIFERFYRADSSRSHTSNEGYGLGLAIAKEIVDAHKGTVSVESKQSRGTSFRILLPIKR